MKRPGVVWVYTIIVVLGLLGNLFTGITLLISPFGRLGMSDLQYYAGILTLVVSIPQAIFMYLFFMLKKSSMTWLYISFGLGLVLSLIGAQWVGAVLTLVIGWVVWDYIKNKKIDDQPVFT